MAGAFPRFDVPDYQPQGDGSYQGLMSTLRGVSRDQDDERRFQIQEARQRASEAFMRAQSEATTRAQASRDKREATTERLKMSDRNKGIAAQIAELARQGRHSEAAALAKASSYVDPESGQERAIQYDPGAVDAHVDMPHLQLDEPTGAPPAPSAAANLARLHGGQLFSSQLHAPAAGIPGAPPAQDEPTEPPPVNGPAPFRAPAPAAYSGLMGALKLKPPAAAPPAITPTSTVTRRNPAMVMPGGERVEFDPEEQRRFQADQAEQHKQQLMGIANDASLPPDVRKAAALRAGLTGAQATGAEGGQIMNVEGREDAQTFKAGESEKDRANRLEIAKRRAAAAAAAGGNFKERSLDERSFNNWVGSNGIKALVPMDRSLSQAAANLTGSRPEDALKHRDSAMQLAGFARGGRPPTDSEGHFLYDAINRSMAGWPDAWVKRLQTGDLSSDMIANLRESVKAARGELAQFRSKAMGSARVALGTDKNANLRNKVAGVGVTLGMDEKEAAAQLGDPSAARFVSGKNKLVDFARAHPKDPRSAAILQKYGGGGGE